jgi:hypothetical protein
MNPRGVNRRQTLRPLRAAAPFTNICRPFHPYRCCSGSTYRQQPDFDPISGFDDHEIFS